MANGQKIPNEKNIHIPISSIARLSKIYPNLDFLLENIPSGNPEHCNPE
jgi:hypothetical protein